MKQLILFTLLLGFIASCGKQEEPLQSSPPQRFQILGPTGQSDPMGGVWQDESTSTRAKRAQRRRPRRRHLPR